MVNNNAFKFGTQERNYWADRLDPQKEAERKAKQEAEEAERRRTMEQHQREQVMNYASPAIVSSIQTYLAKGEMADTATVASDFAQAIPGAAPGLFRQVLDDLKAAGKVYEIQNAPGLMGMRSSHLYLLEG